MLDGVGITVANSMPPQELRHFEFPSEVRFLAKVRLKRLRGIVGIDFSQRFYCAPPNARLVRSEHAPQRRDQAPVSDLLCDLPAGHDKRMPLRVVQRQFRNFDQSRHSVGGRQISQ